jgi:hypothetical protein
MRCDRQDAKTDWRNATHFTLSHKAKAEKVSARSSLRIVQACGRAWAGSRPLPPFLENSAGQSSPESADRKAWNLA